jgi:CysZ protein
MFEATFAALGQMTSPVFRRVLLKAIGLAAVMLVLITIGLNRLFTWMATAGTSWAETQTGVVPHSFWSAIVWIISIVATLGIVTGAVFLMPAVTAFTGSFFVDELAEEVERTRYPAHPPGKALPLPLAMYEGIKTALLAVLVYLCALPFLFFAGFGLVIMFLATAYLLSREYFLLAAMRFHSVEEAKAMRSARSGTIFVAGLPIALFVSIPIVNLATPLFATALMVHTFKRIEGRRVELIEPKRA